MGIKDRRNTEKAEMKKKIMDAAIEIINQDGYTNLSIRKIATKIEYSPTTIYLYYKDKAQIIVDMADALYNKIKNNAVSIIKENPSASPEKQVRDVLLNFIITLSDEPEMAKAIIYSGVNVIFANERKESAPTNEGLTMLDGLFAKGIAQKVFKPNMNDTSWMVISALLGFVISTVENQLYLLENFGRLADNFIEILMGGIKQ